MSFCGDVKTELAELVPDKACCRAALAYGLLEFGHAFTPREISLQTEQTAVAALYSRLVPQVCRVQPPEAGTVRRRALLQTCHFPEAAARQAILERFGHSMGDISVRLNRVNMECDHCARALLRGAFLACGAVTDPQRDYHLEFSVPYLNLSRDLTGLLAEMGIRTKSVTRNGSHVIYIKESERIEDCLTFLGAQRAALEMMNVKMVKSIRNDTNRRFNCENANIDKTVAAAGDQLAALRRIESQCGLAALPEGLQVLAELRLANPDMSLRDLGEAMDPPLSRSGVNHRMQKILAFAAALPQT